jgi:hypothetical protein
MLGKRSTTELHPQSRILPLLWNIILNGGNKNDLTNNYNGLASVMS